MDEKLQVLLQTIVAEPQMNHEEAEREIVQMMTTDAQEIECITTAAQDSMTDENGEVVASPPHLVIEGEEAMEGETVVGEIVGEVQDMEEVEEEDEEANKIKVYKPSPNKPLHASLIAGLNRLNGFQCPHCPRILATKYSLQVHTLVHTGERPHACTLCSSRFTTPGDLRRHMVIHTGEKPYKCDVCDARFTQSGSLKGHSKLHPGEKPHKCEECGETFVAAVLLKAHKRFHSATQRFKCTHCDEMFSTVELVMEHCQVHHMISYEDPNNEVEDGITSVVDVSSILYGRKPSKRKSPCDICGKVLSSVYALQIHKRTHTGEKPYRCEICDYRSTCPSVLKRHMLRHSEEKPFECELCSKGFRQKSHLKKHMLLHDRKKNRCPKCQEEFNGMNALMEHYSENHGNPERPEVCTRCFDDFETEEELEEHIKQTHLNFTDTHLFEDFKCHKCGILFNRKGNLKRHLENSCNGSFQCDKCDENFMKKSKLAEHQWKVHGCKKKYECSLCNKSFTQIYVLKNHEKKIHGPNGVKCPLCPEKSFSSKKALFDHKRTHFAPLCKFNMPGDKDSTEKDVMPHRASIASCLKGKVSRLKTNVLPKKSKKDKDRLYFPCRICDKRFATEDEVLEHFQSHRKNPGHYGDLETVKLEEQHVEEEVEEDELVDADHVINESVMRDDGEHAQNEIHVVLQPSIEEEEQVIATTEQLEQQILHAICDSQNNQETTIQLISTENSSS